ncbi:MAG: hypothetical protein AB7U82_03860 [Blastocatellales bacterium]
MSNKRSRPASEGSPTKGDNFKLIMGVGASIELRLHQAGILTYAQFASLSSDDLITILGNLSGLTKEKIEKQRWIEQARELALKSAPEEPVKEVSTEVTERRNARFSADLRIENGEVIETRVSYLQTGDAETWSGWDERRFINFFVSSAGVRNFQSQAAVEAKESAANIEALDQPPAKTARGVEKRQSAKEAVEEAVAEAVEEFVEEFGQPRLEIVSAESGQPSRVLRHNQPFGVRLLLDLTGLPSSQRFPLDYAAVIQARDLTNRNSQTLFNESGKIEGAGEAIITMKGTSLQPGSYLLSATVTFNPPARHLNSINIGGGLLQIY